MDKKLKYYIESMRLRTLPLSVAGVILGGLAAVSDGYTRWDVFIAALLTTLSLQILSNISNELGDLQKGTDDENRLGPIRSVQSGKLTYKNLLHTMYLFVVLSAGFGLMLVLVSFHTLCSVRSVAMLTLGGCAIVAAIKYTFGKKTYGYVGLGDCFVFVFFGLVSVCGVYYLASGTFSLLILMPAAAIGLLSTAVLNINNLRDVQNDKHHQKKTMVVRMGERNGKLYHAALIGLAFLAMVIFSTIRCSGIEGYLYLLTLPIFYFHLSKVLSSKGARLDSQLKFLSLSSLLFSVLAGIGFVLAG
ncbi:MAG: 1,4-dihydroxy-2-naphthoate octaprenyltransferase [Paludibacteraceae bacterium]